jgi:XTP/dITP diphosphohydrolase
MSINVQVATTNIRKLARFREVLAPLGWVVEASATSPFQGDVSHPQRLSEALAQEAIRLAQQSGQPTLLDESFFEVAGQDHSGLLSVHYGEPQSEDARLEALRQRLKGRPLAERQARFITVMALAFPDGRVEHYQGQTPGVMLDRPQGSAGFGYDPLFLAIEVGRTLAEMSAAERDHFSPWERALRQLLSKHLLARLEGELDSPASLSVVPPLSVIPTADPSPPAPTIRKQVLLATSNPGKVRELREALGPLGWELESMLDYSFHLPPEDGLTFEDNALLKAAFACQHSGLITLADDSGLEVEALNGEPGVRSARFGGKDSDTERNVYLLERMRGVPAEKRMGRFVAVIALAHPDGHIEMYRGETRGRVLEAPRGAWGFGYDPLFLVEETKQTFAEMTIGEKQRFSHRGKALDALLKAHSVGGQITSVAPTPLHR